MSTLQITTPQQMTPETLETILVKGDLSQLSTKQRLEYILSLCHSLGLNPLSKPFELLELDKKLVLYATRNCTDQLREKHRISAFIIDRKRDGDLYNVIAQAKMPNGRQDEAIGTVVMVKEEVEWKKSEGGKSYPVPTGRSVPLSAEARANAQMKAETKAKRRATLSLCGLGGILDESELDTMPQASRTSEPRVDERVLRAGRTAAGIIDELHRIADDYEAVGVGQRPFYEILQEKGWSSLDEVRQRKIRESHELIAALGTKLDAIRAAINEQPPTEPAA